MKRLSQTFCLLNGTKIVSTRPMELRTAEAILAHGTRATPNIAVTTTQKLSSPSECAACAAGQVRAMKPQSQDSMRTVRTRMTELSTSSTAIALGTTITQWTAVVMTTITSTPRTCAAHARTSKKRVL